MIELKVVGMTCGGCVKSVERAISREDANAKVSIDLASGAVKIDSTKPADIFGKAIEAAGYDLAS